MQLAVPKTSEPNPEYHIPNLVNGQRVNHPHLDSWGHSEKLVGLVRGILSLRDYTWQSQPMSDYHGRHRRVHACGRAHPSWYPVTLGQVWKNSLT